MCYNRELGQNSEAQGALSGNLALLIRSIKPHDADVAGGAGYVSYDPVTQSAWVYSVASDKGKPAIRVLIALLFALLGAAWLGAMALWTRPMLDPSYQVGWDFAASYLMLVGIVAGAVFGFGVVFWLPKMPKWGRVLLPLLVLSSALSGFGFYSHNMRVLNSRLLASIKAKNVSGAQESLDHGADINTTDAAGLTPLALALRRKDCKMVDCLLGYFPARRQRELEEVSSVCGQDLIIP